MGITDKAPVEEKTEKTALVEKDEDHGELENAWSLKDVGVMHLSLHWVIGFAWSLFGCC